MYQTNGALEKQLARNSGAHTGANFIRTSPENSPPISSNTRRRHLECKLLAIRVYPIQEIA